MEIKIDKQEQVNKNCFLSVFFSVCLSVCLSVCMYVSLSLCPSVCLPVSLFICLSKCLLYFRFLTFYGLRQPVLFSVDQYSFLNTSAFEIYSMSVQSQLKNQYCLASNKVTMDRHLFVHSNDRKTDRQTDRQTENEHQSQTDRQIGKFKG